MSDLSQLLKDFIARAEGEHKEWIARAAGMAQAMIDEGESDIALENFCENLAEWQCAVPTDLFARLGSLAQTLGMDGSCVQALKAQVK